MKTASPNVRYHKQLKATLAGVVSALSSKGIEKRHLTFGGEGAKSEKKQRVPTDARSEFLANRAMGDWAEKVLIAALTATLSIATLRLFSLLFVTVPLLYALTACATGPRMAHHEFSFGAIGENEGIEVLNYRYGDSKMPGTYETPYWLSKGHIGQGGGIHGTFPVGDSLYVKWRVKSTGKIYEETVDLKSRLPSDMNDKTVHFLINGSQLFVYLISKEGAAPGAPDCKASAYKDYKCTELYPEHWANF
jgi:hypothetical protein